MLFEKTTQIRAIMRDIFFYVQITNEATEQIYPAQTQELSEIKEIYNIRYYIRESIIFFEIAKFAYEITKVHVYIWQLPRGNIGGIMMKTN